MCCTYVLLTHCILCQPLAAAWLPVCRRLVASWEMGHSCLRISIIPEHPLREHHDLSMFSWWILADKQGFLLGGSDQGMWVRVGPRNAVCICMVYMICSFSK